MFEDWLKKTGKWLEGTGPYADIAVSSRIRLARNLDGANFTTRATPESAAEVWRQVKAAASEVIPLNHASSWEMASMADVDRHVLVERHLISHDLAESPRHHRAVVIDPEERISVMVNEEDHIRLQVIASGWDLPAAWTLASGVDRVLSSKLTYAFSPSWGYLTCCPTNVGTGLRASVMVHIPALVFLRRAEKLLQRASQLGLVVRGLYGEGREVKSVFFQVSNQVSLGKPEQDLIENVAELTRQLIEYEHQARQTLLKDHRVKIEDSVWRAYGVLLHARSVTSAEATDLLSTVRLGVELGLIQEVSIRTLNDLLVLAQPAHIQKRLGKGVEEGARDRSLAEFLRTRLKKAA